MRRALAAIAALLVVVLALAALRWQASGSLLWNPDTGELKSAEWWSPNLRWRWQPTGASPVSVALTLPTRDGISVEAQLEWSPPEGKVMRLAPAASPAAAFADLVGKPIESWSKDLSFGCFVAELAAPDCPGNPAREASEQVAAALRAQAGATSSSATGVGRLRVRFAAGAQAVKSYLARGIRASLPPTPARVMVMAVDGLDWDYVEPLMGDGRMPNLAGLTRAGTWGTMETLVPILSPLIWTSVATGVSPDRHGILDFVERDRETDQVVPVSARSRKSPAIWEMASVLGKRVDVVGWWATWPAGAINGTLVSDRLYYTLTQGIEKAVFDRDPEHLVYPVERTEEFTALRKRAVDETDWTAVRPFIAVDEAEFSRALARDAGMEDPIDGFRRILASTRTYMGSGLILAQEKPDLLMVYLEGTDTIGHLLARFQPPPVDTDVTDAEAARYAEAIPRYYQAADRWIGRYLAECPLAECTWILISDHGFKWGRDRPRGLGGFSGRTAPLWHATDAAFVVAGVGARAQGRTSAAASVYDVAPTIAAALGIPADESWSGKPLPGAPPAVGLPPVEYAGLTVLPAEQFGAEVAGAAQDREFLDKLRALGYLGGDGEQPIVKPETAAGASAPQPQPPAPSGGARTRGELNNLGVLKINQKEYSEAEALLREAIALDPEYPSPHYNLRRIYMEQERYDDADRELWISIDLGLRSPERTLDQAAGDYDNLDLPERSKALLLEAVRRFPDHEPLPVHLMVVLIRLEECARAAEVGEKASARFPESAPVHAFYGLGAACAGDAAAARRAISRSLELNPDQARLRQVLATLDP